MHVIILNKAKSNHSFHRVNFIARVGDTIYLEDDLFKTAYTVRSVIAYPSKNILEDFKLSRIHEGVVIDAILIIDYGL